MRRPAAVLIDGELEATPLRELDEFAAVVEVLDEGLLRQHVLVGVQGSPHEVEADVRVSGDVEDPHVRVAQHGIEIIGDARAGKIGFAPRTRALKIGRADDDHVEAIARIGFEMRTADAACADQRNRRAAILRHRRTIGQVGRFNFDRRFGDQSIVVGRRPFGLPRVRRRHGSRASVRRSRAESAAVSTMR